MKITAFFMLTACLQLSAAGFGQPVSVSFKNAPLESVFREIQKQTGLSFIYTRDDLKKARTVTLTVNNQAVEKVLEACFKNQPLTYTMVDRYIVVKPAPFVENRTASSVVAPPFRDAGGKVVNENGEPVAGATVTVKGTLRATTTNTRGEFLLRGLEENAVLEISFVGYETQTIAIAGREPVLVRLQIAVRGLEETVIKGYYSTSKRLNTGSVGKVTRDEISNQPVNNPLLALQSRVPGVIVTQSTGLPGSSVSVLIRGKGSLSARTEPLYIIDGVPYNPNTVFTLSGASPGESAFISINPADIESMEVLKDADATAIYGSRGANGVVLITTKKAKAGKTSVDINVQHGISEAARRAHLMSTEQYLQLRKDAFANDGVTPTAVNAPDLISWDAAQTTDWQDLLFGRTARFTDAQVSLSGGTNLARVLFQTGYHKENTVFAPSSLGNQRFSTRLNADLNSHDNKLNVNATFSYSVNETDLPRQDASQDAFRLPPNYPMLNADGTPNWNGGFVYPLAFLEGSSQYKSHMILAHTALRYRLFPGLEIRTSVGYNRRTSDQESLTPLSAQNPATATSSSRFAHSYTESYIIEPQLDYRLRQGQSQFEALVGGTLQESRSNNEGLTATGFSSDAFLSNPAAAGSITINNISSAHYRYNSVFARLSYDWNKKYIANVTFRRDGSSRFGPGKRFGNFGAVGAGWIFSEESLVKDHLPFLSFGKIRGSYGLTGNDQIGDYAYLPTYTSNTAYQGTGSLWPSRVTNDDFGWEENRKLELAAELGFFKDRLFISASHYRNRSSNSLISYALPPSTGFSTYQANFPALVENTGWEFLVNSTNISTKNFKWETSFNLSKNDNKLVSFPGIEKTSYSTLYAEGASLYRGRLLHFLGVDPETGLARFEDLNDDGVISWFGTSHDMKYYDNDLNEFYGGLSNTLSYKSIRLDFLFDFVKRRGATSFINVQPGTPNNQYAGILDYWKKPGDLTSIPKPSATPGKPGYTSYQNWLLSDAQFGDASYIKLRNVSLSYSLPSGWLQKVKVSKAEVFARAQNLFSITGYDVLDPETGNFVVPPARVITAGIHCQF